MTAPLTDDDLGAALRAVLQDLSPLATDPLPPPRFAPTAVLDTAIIADANAAAEPVVVDLGDLRAARARPRRARRSRRAVGVGVALVVAAAAVVAVAALTGGAPVGVTAPAARATVSPPVLPTVPDRGGAFLGVTPDPVPWRCTAPAGTSITSVVASYQYSPTVFSFLDGVTCAPFPDDVGRFGFDADGLQVPLRGPAAVQAGGANFCGFVATQTGGGGLAFRSTGPADYVEFFGPACRLVVPAR